MVMMISSFTIILTESDWRFGQTALQDLLARLAGHDQAAAYPPTN